MGFSFFFISFLLSSFFLFFLEMFLMLLRFDCNLSVLYLLSRLSVREPTYLCQSSSFSLCILNRACLSVCRWVWLICQIVCCFCIHSCCMFVCCFCVCSCLCSCVVFFVFVFSVCLFLAFASLCLLRVHLSIFLCLCVWLAVVFASVCVSGCFSVCRYALLLSYLSLSSCPSVGLYTHYVALVP